MKDSLLSLGTPRYSVHLHKEQSCTRQDSPLRSSQSIPATLTLSPTSTLCLIFLSIPLTVHNSSMLPSRGSLQIPHHHALDAAATAGTNHCTACRMSTPYKDAIRAEDVCDR